MDDYHQQLEHHIRDMKNRLHYSYHNANDPMARVINHELQRAEDMARGRHDLRHIEERLRVAETQINRARYMPQGSEIMHEEHANHFHQDISSMRNDMRRRNNF
jgi:hypothetical protein